MRPDEQALRMLKRISRERDFIPFLEAQAAVLARNSLTQDGAHMYRSQGGSLALDDLVQAITRAAELQ